MLKNPKECFCLKQKQTFFILNELTMPTGEDDDNAPLLFHHQTFSRFKFAIINENKEATTANIPVDMIPGILQKVDNLYLIDQLKPVVKQPDGNNTSDADNPAYKTVISMGTFKGKTPASVLLEDSSKNRPLLVNQMNYLKQYVNKYPRNQVQIDAIEQALKLLDSGKLNAEVTTTAVPTAINVFSTGMRPLIRRKDNEGNSFVYEISITWTGEGPRPLCITINNYFAPVVQQDNGLLNVMAKNKKNEIKNSFYMTMDEWLWMKRCLNRQMDTFEDIHAKKLYQIATEADIANKNAYAASARVQR